jgi:hypothetical protein
MNNDIYSNINTFSTYIASSITVYFVFNDAINKISYSDQSKNLYLQVSLICLSLSTAYGPAYIARKINSINQKDNKLAILFDIKIDNLSEYLYKDDISVDESIISDKKRQLSINEKFVLAFIFLINVCYSVFPCLFLFTIFTKQNELKAIKTGIICASSLFGCLSAVAPIRNAKNFLIENKG